MKKYCCFIVSALCCILSVNVCSSSKQIQVATGAICACFEVKLPENPTTGYQWTLESYDQALFTATKNKYMVSNPKLIGSSGEHIFYFKQKENTICPESTVLYFRHARSWESSDSGECKKITFQFSQKTDTKN
jgi:inhibitor of cysteine peptidase